MVGRKGLRRHLRVYFFEETESLLGVASGAVHAVPVRALLAAEA